MASFFSHGFASGGGSSNKGKKKSEEEGIWMQVVDGRGQMNWQHSVTGAYWGPFHPAPVQHMVGGAYAVQPMAQPVYQPANPWGVHVVPVSPVAVTVVADGKKKKKKKEKGGYWDSCRDEDGVRCYKHSRTQKVTYIDPYV